MPQQLFDPADVQKTFAMLTVDNHNAALLNEISPCASVDEELCFGPFPPGYHFVRAENRIADIPNEHFELALVNEITQEIVYYNRVIYQKDAFLNYMPVTQILIWRSPKPSHRGVLRDLPGKVFSHYLLEKYNVIVTDRHQTRDGMSFWQSRLYDAIASGHHLYAYDMITCEMRPIVKDSDIGDQVNWLWGDEEHHQNRLAIISKFPLSISA
ncbi:hypothetical protein [Enterobacter pasteurii]